MANPTKLHLGCGTKHLAGWVNIDSVASCNPDLIHDLQKPLPYEDLSVDEILAEDLLEHFDKYLRHQVFYEWARVLKMDGLITIQVPDFKKTLFKYFKFGFNNFVDFIFGENLLASKVYLGHFGNHKWGYSQKSLKEFVALFAIEAVDMKTKGLNIHFVGKKKKHLSYKEAGHIKIPSHANRCGDGQDSVSFEYAREKIKEFQDSQNN